MKSSGLNGQKIDTMLNLFWSFFISLSRCLTTFFITNKITFSTLIFINVLAMAIAATPSAAKFDIKTNTVAKHSRNTHDDHRAKTHDLDINKIIEGMNGNEKIRHPNEINRKHNLMPSPLVEGFTGHFAKSIHSKSKYPEFPYESQSTKSHQSSADPEDTKDGPLNDEKEKKKYHRFSKTKFDENYPVHDLCDQIHSGGQTDNLEWSESADRILKVIGNGVMKNGYNMFMAPGQVEGKSTEVSVAIYIESMSSFKAQTMDFEIDMYLALGWYDRRLAHNCSHPILVTHKFIADRFFTPDLYFVNSRFAYLQEVTTPNFMLYVYPDGMIFKSMRIDATLSCVMDLKLFPWDSQECSIIIQSYAYIENLLTLSWHVDPPHFPIGSNSEIKLNDMEIKGTRFESCSGPYPMFRGQGNWSCVKAIIKMKRLILFHLIQIFLPASMLVVVSMLSLWLDPRASPARIALATTSLLTVITLGNGQRADLPQVSYLKGSDYWLAFSQSLIFMVLIEYSFVSYYMTKKTTHCHHKRVLEGEDSNEDHQCMGTNGQDFATGKEKMLLPEWDAEKRNKKRFRMGYFRNRSEDSAFRIKKKNHGFSNGFKPDYQINGIKGKRLSVEHGLYGEEYRKPLDTTPYSVATGIGKCMNATAFLCTSTTTPQPYLENIRKMSTMWERVANEVETAALMSGNTLRSQIPMLDFKFDETKPCPKCADENENIARKIDLFSRAAFPALFVTFISVYFWYFGYYTQND